MGIHFAELTKQQAGSFIPLSVFTGSFGFDKKQVNKLNIIVCVKQVPDITEVRINKETNTIIREGIVSIINPFDTYAIEKSIAPVYIIPSKG